MRLVSGAFEWVRTVLRRPHGSRRPARSATPETGPSLPVRHPSPEMWGAILAGARRRRAPHLWPALQRPAIKDHPAIDAPVRAYVLPEERTRPLACATREVR